MTTIIKQFRQTNTNNLIFKKRMDTFTARVTKAVKALQEQSKDSVEINLSGEQISDEACVAISDGLKTNTTIESLNLTWCRVSDGGMTTLGDALKKNQHLTRLDVFGNRSVHDGYKALFASLHNNKHLLAIDIDVEARTVDSLLELLIANDTLSSVRLFLVPSGQDDEDIKFLKIYQAIGSNHSLQRAVFVAEPRSDVVMAKEPDAIASMIRSNRRLTALHLYGYSPDIKKFRDAVESNWCLMAFNVPRDAAFCATIKERNKALQWRVVHPLILNICIAMAPLQLPAYVMLWIIDFLPFFEAALSHRKKIALIESITHSYMRIYEKREAETSSTSTK